MVTVFETLLGYILSIDYPKRECESVCVCVCVCVCIPSSEVLEADLQLAVEVGML